MDILLLGKKIKEYRLNNKMSQSKLADIVGLSTRYITEIERGYKVPKLETFIKILNALNASSDYVLQNDLNFISKESLFNLENKLAQLPYSHQKELMSILDFMIEQYKKS